MCEDVDLSVRKSARQPLPHLFDDDLAILVDGAVVDHAHYGHAQVTSDAEGDAEAQAAHDGDDVAAGQTEAPAVAQRGLLLRGLPGPPILRQLDHLPGFLPSFYHPATAKRRGVESPSNTDSSEDDSSVHRIVFVFSSVHSYVRFSGGPYLLRIHENVPMLNHHKDKL